MMQIHDIIENFPINNDRALQAVKLGLFLDWPSFDFGAMDQTLGNTETLYNLIDYAHELARADIFKLSYDSVYYSWFWDNEIYGAFVSSSKKDDKSIITLNIYIAQKKPFRVAAIGVVGLYDFGKGPQSSAESITTNSVVVYKNPEFRFAEQDHNTMFANITYAVIALAALMESQHTKTRMQQVGDKLNNKREKRGLPKIMPFHTVYFEVDGKEYNTDGTFRGTGAQKRMHWRRGHVRHLSSGKITHVRPCLVGSLGNDVEVKKPAYVMRKKGNAA